jgi:MurNAc alpha-1-phosphate uridylyltransferase
MKALPLLGAEPFIVVNGDIWIRYDFSSLLERQERSLFHGVVIRPPAHHLRGDFCLNRQGRLTHDRGDRVVFAGVSLVSPDLFSLPVTCEREKLRSWIYAAMRIDEASAELFSDEWVDVGTPERLARLEERVKKYRLA